MRLPCHRVCGRAGHGDFETPPQQQKTLVDPSLAGAAHGFDANSFDIVAWILRYPLVDRRSCPRGAIYVSAMQCYMTEHVTIPELCAFCGQAHIIKDDACRGLGVPLILFSPGQFLLHATLFLHGQASKQIACCVGTGDSELTGRQPSALSAAACILYPFRLKNIAVIAT